MQSEWMKTRQTKYTLYVAIYLVVIVAILGAANWLANRHNKSIDSTSNKKFSLSDQTVKVVKGLTKDVTITDYDKTSAFTTSRDLLDRYSNLSSKLRVVYVDPDKKPQLAKAAGIRSYGQIIVDSGTKKEEAKSLTEEEVTGALIRSMKSGGRALVMLDPPLKIGKEETADNVAVNKVLESWGVTMIKDLAIDASGVGQIFGLSEVVPLVTSYDSNPIVREMKDSATAFPL